MKYKYALKFIDDNRSKTLCAVDKATRTTFVMRYDPYNREDPEDRCILLEIDIDNEELGTGEQENYDIPHQEEECIADNPGLLAVNFFEIDSEKVFDALDLEWDYKLRSLGLK
ncbi:hypothetical protein [Sabulibacter ruber]|uniref:hypothetical protein n=1 Tax=Sabulibacter ruber TaxID=2811901 RepID=UPI001A973512|nr:hypothetical protein [Sabulibacter ruber]